eukprot:1646713-Rhodomonas_salina.5
MQRRRWQQAAAVAAGATGIYLAYRSWDAVVPWCFCVGRWMEYKQEEEDAEAARTYYRSSRHNENGEEGQLEPRAGFRVGMEGGELLGASDLAEPFQTT